jgi:nucleoside-diphosphate-sugar epimerase
LSHILIAGLGDLGQSLAQRWLDEGHQVSGIRRQSAAPAGVDLYSQDLAADTVLLPPDTVELLYIIMTPSSRDEAGYERAYLTAPLRLLDALGEQQPLPPTVFVSSTAVYGDADGDVSESTPPSPTRFNGKIILAAEQELSTRTVMSTVRFSGIYGPGRMRLLRQVDRLREGGEMPKASFTNRIHSHDCVGLLKHVGERFLARDMPPGVIVGTDSAPSPNLEVLNWLARERGTPLDLPVPEQVPGKRLRSEYLRDGHYSLVYPDYRQGYQQVMASLASE